jgi:hypothetical protein
VSGRWIFANARADMNVNENKKRSAGDDDIASGMLAQAAEIRPMFASGWYMAASETSQAKTQPPVPM